MLINSAVQSPCELETVVIPILQSVGIEVCGEIGLDKGFLEPQGELGFEVPDTCSHISSAFPSLDRKVHWEWEIKGRDRNLVERGYEKEM